MSWGPSKDQKAQWKSERQARDAKAKQQFEKDMAKAAERNKGKGGDSGQSGALASIFGW